MVHQTPEAAFLGSESSTIKSSMTKKETSITERDKMIGDYEMNPDYGTFVAKIADFRISNRKVMLATLQKGQFV